MNTLRYILGLPVAAVGMVILLLHLFLFIKGVVLRKPVPTALPGNFLILVMGFSVLPLPYAVRLGFALALIDLILWLSVNKFRRRVG